MGVQLGAQTALSTSNSKEVQFPAEECQNYQDECELANDATSEVEENTENINAKKGAGQHAQKQHSPVDAGLSGNQLPAHRVKRPTKKHYYYAITIIYLVQANRCPK